MDKGALVGVDLDEGRKFLELLESARVPITVAMWQYSELGDRWRLLVATPLVDQVGVRETYRRFDDILSKARKPPGVDLLDVSLFTPTASFIKSLRKELRNVVNKPLKKQPVGDHLIDEGFIYFVR